MQLRNTSNDLVNSIPVIIDDVKLYEDFQMTRCSYFTIENEDPDPNWILNLEKQPIPFTLIILSGVITNPLIGEEFKSAEQIEELFTRINDVPNLYVDSNDIWLPNILLGQAERGWVYRVDRALFIEAIRFRNGNIGQEQFIGTTSNMKRLIRSSESETKAFDNFEHMVISRLKESYPKNSKYELKYSGD